MMYVFRKLIISLVLCTLYIPSAKAIPLTVNGGWYYFTFPGQLSIPFDPSFSWEQDFSFVLTKPALLKVQDIGSGGDTFQVYDNGITIGTTSALFPENTGAYFDPNLAALDPALDQGSFLLSAGNHTISGSEINNTTDSGGGAYLRVDTIPEPTIITLLAIGCVACSINRRKKLKSMLPVLQAR